MTALPRSTEYVIKSAGGLDIVGIDCVTSNAEGKAADDINALWLRFFEEAIGDKIPGRTGDSIYAAYTGYQGDHTLPFRVVIGCEAQQNTGTPPGMVRHFIPQQRYGFFQSIGEQPTSLIRTWERIWDMPALPRSFTTDFEVYGPRFFEPGLHEVMVHIALENIQ
jgi:predicted transcriptional regulator YdeE